MSVETFSPDQVQVSMTDKAIAHSRRQLQSTGAKGMRLGVAKSGCSGFKYVVDLVEQPEAEDKIFELAEDVKLFVDLQALSFVNGIEIDYVTEGLNSTLTFNNPNAKDVCGCGESFNIG